MMSGTEQAWGGDGLLLLLLLPSELMLEEREREIASSLLQRFSPCLGLRRVLEGVLSPSASGFSCHLASAPRLPSSIVFSLPVSTFASTSRGSLNRCFDSPRGGGLAGGAGVRGRHCGLG